MSAILRSLRALLVFSVLTGLLYPLLFTGAAQVAFSNQADGSMLESAGAVVGSELIGQVWEGDEWFYGRDSGIAYDASSSAGRNLGPISADLSEQIAARIDVIIERETPFRGETVAEDIPVDLVTASSSGLDPHISVAAALFQVPRIAELRDLSETEVRRLIDRHTSSKTFGIWGQEHVNVLRLNLDLQRIAGT
jgi:potassium-transporting ATPase KdpC subunit